MKLKKNSLPFKEIALKHKYNIENEENVVLIEEKGGRVVAEIIMQIVRIIVYTLLLALAFIGLISIINPDTRDILINQATSIVDEFMGLW
jgi:hypothetical protein